jgi:nucleoside-diphosphate-sugar epimerase
MAKVRVLLTGASGSMGNAAFSELIKKRDEYDLVLLLRPSKKNKSQFARYVGSSRGNNASAEGDLTIVWGDLTNPQDVAEAVNGCDFVLHPAAFISPEADHDPAAAKMVNLEGTKNIIGAIKRQPSGGSHVKLVYIGSVAEYGDRLAPIYRIRTGDPLKPSIYDFYATTKIAAERVVIESGLRYWASLRQTYIALPRTLTLLDPIMFHQPIDQHIELITNEDAGFGLAQCLNAPEDFWCRIYNMGGGPSCRVVYVDYIRDMMELFGLGDYREIMDRNWFCLRNFHCGWFEDSSLLNQYLHHWRHSLKDHYRQVKENAPSYATLAKAVPKQFIKLMMKRMANDKNGPLYWIRSNNVGRISAFFGSMEKWRSIRRWDTDMPELNAESYLLNHGYEQENESDLTLQDLREAAAFRGGECLSDNFHGMGGMHKWRCAFGHVFEGTPTLVLRGGHWCPECEAPPWNYDKIAKKNPFLAQAYFTNHGRDEDHFYDKDCYLDIL